MIFTQAHKHVVMIAPIAKTSASTTTAYVDLKGFKYADIVVAVGALKNTNGVPPKTIKLQESDDTVATNFADITGLSTSAGPTAGGSVRFCVDARKRKRYLGVSITTETTTNDDQTIFALAELSRAAQAPSDTNGFGNTVVKIG